MKFEWHGPKATANMRKHGVSFDEAATVFADFLSTVFPDPDHSDDKTRFLIICMSLANRVLVVSHAERYGRIRIISARETTQKEQNSMKKTVKKSDELRLEYDFALMTGGVRGKYADSYRQEVNIVKLDDDVSAAFPDAKAVNDALRSLIRIAQTKIKHA